MKGPGIAVNHTDRRHTQTEHEYAATDLETMQEARRYGDHLFNLFREHIGKRVLEIGCGIGTMSQRLLDVADEVVAMEPNRYCASRTRELLGAHPRFTMHECLLEELRSGRARVAPVRHGLLFQRARTHRRRCGRAANVPGCDRARWQGADLRAGHTGGVRSPRCGAWPPSAVLKATLGRAFREAGLPLQTLRYTNPIGLAGWMFNAHVTKSTTHSLAQVKIFDNLIAPVWALPLESLIPPPVGLSSLVAVGRKQ